jgi:serralysin
MATPTTSSQVTAVSASGNTIVDALWSGVKWGGAVQTGGDVTYSFPGTSPTWSTASTDAGGYGAQSGSGEPWSTQYAPLSEAQKVVFRQALDAWAQVANITFIELADAATVAGDIRVAFSGAVSSSASAHAYTPSSTGASGGDVWISPSASSSIAASPGSFGFFLLLHEIGHALGLKHPFEDSPTLPAATENQRYSVMSYTTASGASVYPSTPMLYDIAAIQRLYGANNGYHGGNDTYQISSTREELKVIADAGGTDVLDASTQTFGARIDLNPGTFSSIGITSTGGAATNNIGIAFDVVVEAANGGSGGDTITGTLFANTITGNAGADVVSAGAGDDTVTGNAGDDTLNGNAGDDLAFGGQGSDSVYGGQGNDQVFGDNGADRVYGDNGADRVYGGIGGDLCFGGAGNDTLYGGADGDTLYGGADNDLLYGDRDNDLLFGDRGNDTLTGGSGGDRFAFNPGSGVDLVSDFNFGEGDRIQLASGMTYTVAMAANGDTMIVFADGGNATLAGIRSSQVSADWFVTA